MIAERYISGTMHTIIAPNICFYFYQSRSVNIFFVSFILYVVFFLVVVAIFDHSTNL